MIRKYFPVFFCIFLLTNLSAQKNKLSINLNTGKSSTIYYETFGEGKPIIILHRSLIGYIEPIFKDQPEYKRIYIDPPGIGNSSSDEWIRTADDILDITTMSIDSLVKNEKYLVAGFSYFGYMARGILEKREKQVDGLLMMCPVVEPASSTRTLPRNFDKYVDSAFVNTLNSNEKEMISRLVLQNEETYNNLMKYGSNRVGMDVEFWNSIKENNYSFTFDTDDEVYQIPVLLFAGLQDDVVGYKDQLMLIDIFPRASIVVVDYASHMLPYEQFDIIDFHINKWLEVISYHND